jgi:hypothetical protein
MNNPKSEIRDSQTKPARLCPLRLGASLALGAWCLALLFCPNATAQSYSIDWYKIGGGGGTSTNGQYSLTGAIGQPDAGAAMSGGNYALTGGFWSLIAVVQTAGMPTLSITRSGSSVVVSWPNSAACTLQQSSSLSAPSGWTTSGCTPTTSNGTNSITIASPTGNMFFRLSQP